MEMFSALYGTTEPFSNLFFESATSHLPFSLGNNCHFKVDRHQMNPLNPHVNTDSYNVVVKEEEEVEDPSASSVTPNDPIPSSRHHDLSPFKFSDIFFDDYDPNYQGDQNHHRELDNIILHPIEQRFELEVDGKFAQISRRVAEYWPALDDNANIMFQYDTHQPECFLPQGAIMPLHTPGNSEIMERDGIHEKLNDILNPEEKIVKYRQGSKKVNDSSQVSVLVDYPVRFISNNFEPNTVVQQWKKKGAVRTMSLEHPSLNIDTSFSVKVRILGRTTPSARWKSVNLKNIIMEIVKAHTSDYKFSLKIYNFTPKKQGYRAGNSRFKIQVSEIKIGEQDFAMKRVCQTEFKFTSESGSRTRKSKLTKLNN